jgi:DNA processing protein
MREILLQQVALSLLPGIGPVITRQLINYCGSIEHVFNTSLKRLSAIPGVGPKTAEIITSGRVRDQANEQLKLAEKIGASIHFYTEKGFPNRLRNLENGPIVLYSTGQPAFNNSRTLGIVGTRRATNYGRRAISRLLTQLKPYQPTVVSGLAYGIDIAAHREALKLELPTIAVLGSGLDRIYPEAHKETAKEMLTHGGLVTELKFGTKPEMYHFPSRNRIIAGLSDALVVVEARKIGGALITVEYMLGYGKPCLSVPGPIDAPTSNGSNQLIKDKKAYLVTSGDDIARLLGWIRVHQKTDVLPASDKSSEGLILEVLEGNANGIQIDELCWRTHIPINKVGVHLLNLEFKGMVKPLPGKKFLLVDK